MRRVALLGLGLLAAGAILPPPALAHGLSGRADLPIPMWLFGWVAAAVLVISFVALATLWRAPRLERYSWRPLPRALSLLLAGRATDLVCGTIGVFLLGVLLWAGFAGVQSAADNVVPTFVYVVFWVGLAFASILFGNVFAAFNPWLAIGRAVSALATRLAGDRLGAGLPYPERLGRWPAAAGLVAFAWLELVSPSGVEPRTLAAAALVYSSITFLGMGLFGVEAWARNGEAFSVYFGLFGRLAPFERRGREVGTRPFSAGLAGVEPGPGLVAVLAVMIGTVTFDGFQESNPWSEIGPRIADFFGDIGIDAALADELAAGVGMLAAIGVIGGFYLLGIRGMRSVGGGAGTGLATAFVHSLVPIAFVYVAAHYVTFMLYQGQAMGFLVSNPLGEDWDLFGTAAWSIDYELIGATVTWYCQVALVVAGHVTALGLAHDRALVRFADAREAARSQYWMLAIMIGFTSLALWLLSEANA